MTALTDPEREALQEKARAGLRACRAGRLCGICPYHRGHNGIRLPAEICRARLRLDLRRGWEKNK